MNMNAMKTIAIIAGSFFATAVVGLAHFVFDLNDPTLKLALVSLFSAGAGVDFYLRLRKRFGKDLGTAQIESH